MHGLAARFRLEQLVDEPLQFAGRVRHVEEQVEIDVLTIVGVERDNLEAGHGSSGVVAAALDSAQLFVGGVLEEAAPLGGHARIEPRHCGGVGTCARCGELVDGIGFVIAERRVDGSATEVLQEQVVDL